MFKLFNPHKYEEQNSGLTEISLKTIQLFLNEISHLKHDLQSALIENKKDRIHICLHSIRGSVSNFYAADIDLLCKILDENYPKFKRRRVHHTT